MMKSYGLGLHDVLVSQAGTVARVLVAKSNVYAEN